jgi:hypothetical protein
MRGGIRTPRHRSLVWGVLLGCLLTSTWGEAARVRHVGLSEMVGRGGKAFVGRCVERAVAADDSTGLSVTTYTFLVTEPIIGVVRGRTTFRVVGSPASPLIEGLPVFEPGDEALLFLYPESSSGLTSAIGLDQGNFKIVKDPKGHRRALNARGNERLLSDVPEAVLRTHGLRRKSTGPLELQSLLDTARALASRRGP